MRIDAKTKITGLIGYPVEHSLSPYMHNSAFNALNLNCVYVTFPVKPEHISLAIMAIRALNILGVNVTVPHKESVIPFLDEIDREAQDIGAANTIVNIDGRLKGYNTDGRGFMESLKERGILVKDKNVFIIGAGGASKAVAYYLAREVSRLYIYDIDTRKADDLKDSLRRFSDNVYSVKEMDYIKESHLIINATPLGLKEGDPSPVPLNLLNKEQIVYDLIYKKTVLLRESSSLGCRTMDGLGMLLWQGVFAFELWTGMKPPVEVMRNALFENARF